MTKTSILKIRLDDQGHLILPNELMDQYGLFDGAEVRLSEDSLGFGLSQSTHSLARIYLEPTNLCNLDCRTCMRHGWEEPLGRMDAATFSRILGGVAALPVVPELFFGGFGEPLSHPDILEMVAAAKHAVPRVELITNGILLTPEISAALIQLGLDRLWVSIDGATPESYADVRLGSELPRVISNLEALRSLKYQAASSDPRNGPGQARPRLGIAFVAMKRNLKDLPQVIDLGKRLGADTFSISNVLAHTPEMLEEALYQGVSSDTGVATEWSPRLLFPRMEFAGEIGRILAESSKKGGSLAIARQDMNFGANRCPFVEKASMSVRWDGAVSPCLALLHDHENHLGVRRRRSLAYSMGNVNQLPLREIWFSEAYLALRERILSFDFSFCTACNSCDLADSNQEDCFGNVAPTCGGCLWAQGLIQCP
jgi:MoaA/NifB/PqqE/SkfB family radical SAM enzyme